MAAESNDNIDLLRTIDEMKAYITELERIIDIHTAKDNENIALLNAQVKRLCNSREWFWKTTPWRPAAWLKLAGFKFLWRDHASEWVASENKPKWNGRWFDCLDGRVLRLTTLNFTPPPATYTQEIIDL